MKLVAAIAEKWTRTVAADVLPRAADVLLGVHIQGGLGFQAKFGWFFQLGFD